jgi:hypothetical protein
LSPTPNEKVGPLIAELRRYVLAHPRAADTLGGVTRWWLSPTLAQTALPSDVEAALVELSTLGLIEQRVLPDGSTLFVARAP